MLWGWAARLWRAARLLCGKPMITGLTPLKVDEFAGLVTYMDANDLPPFASPDCPDVEFAPGLVRTRPGLRSLFTAVSANPKVNGILEYILPDLTPRPLFITAGTVNGIDVYREVSGNLILQTPSFFCAPQNSFADGLTMQERAYLCVHDGQHGVLPPVRYFDQSLEWARIAPSGPDLGTFGLAQLLMTEGAPASGNIAAGQHYVTVFFETNSGYWTRPLPFEANSTFFTASGGRNVTVDRLPIGPPWVKRRIVAFTAAGGSEFYFVPSKMVVSDNTTNSLTVDFTDSELLNATNIDHLFRRLELPAVAKMLAYQNRIVYLVPKNLKNYAFAQDVYGEKSLSNLSFDGGYVYSTPFQTPLGWQNDATFGAGGSLESADVVRGFAYKIGGDGVTSRRGEIFKVGFLPFTQLFDPNSTYTIRAWVRRSPGLTQGTLRIQFDGASSTGLTVTAAQMSSVYQPFEATILLATDILSGVLTLRLWAENTPTAGQNIYVDEMEIFPSAEPWNEAEALVSDSEDPEAIDGVKGRIQLEPGTGNALRNGFVIRDNLYFARQRGIFTTQGIGDPSEWDFQIVSAEVGAPGPRAIGEGDEWVVIAHRTGLWYFDGGALTEEHRLSTEIQPTWDGINWAYDYLIETKVDIRNKKIFVSVPYGTSTVNNRLLVLDYTQGFGNPLFNAGRGRKWTFWNVQANSMNLVRRFDGTRNLIVGNGAGTGKLYQFDATARDDDGAAINSYWQSGMFGGEQRNLFGYLTMQVQGAGTLALRAFRGGQTDVIDLRGFTLDSRGLYNKERQLNITRERMALRCGTNAVGEYFSLQSLALWARGQAWAPVRGVNR